MNELSSQTFPAYKGLDKKKREKQQKEVGGGGKREEFDDLLNKIKLTTLTKMH